MKQSRGDRARVLAERANEFTGIDFVHVVDACDQTELHVFFLTDATSLNAGFEGAGALGPEDIEIVRIGDESARPLRVAEIVEVAGSQVQIHPIFERAYLALRVEEPGDFGDYRLTIHDPQSSGDPYTEPFSRIDPVFNGVSFSFKAGCEQGSDCLPPGAECPPEDLVDFPVDYLARDFTSFREALLDYAAQRYPQWQMPLEADVGVMLAEVMSALGDELSYLQDRIGREAYLETATQRRSLRHKARLVDFEIHDGQSPSTWLALTVADETTPGVRFLPQRARAWARAEGEQAIPFEVGRGLSDTTQYPVHSSWNEEALTPYCFDESQACLLRGAREVVVVGQVLAEPMPRKMLLATDPDNPAVPARRIIVTVESLEELRDPLEEGSEVYTRIRFFEPLPHQLDQNVLRLNLNVVPATAGATVVEEFWANSDAGELDRVHAVVRQGSLSLRSSASEGQAEFDADQACLGRDSRELGRAPIVLYGLTRTPTSGLGFLGAALRTSVPEIVLRRLDVSEGWTFRRNLLEASPGDRVFTIEDGLWTRVRRFRTERTEYVHQDYASGQGYSLRFGDGEFGRIPPVDSHFEVTYRTGPGVRGNLPAGSVTARSARDGEEDPGGLPDYVTALSNPLEITSGVDPESADDIRLLAPEAYQAGPLFAVRPEDYGARAEDLPFVQRAQGASRWTGTWLSTFVTLDPRGATELSERQLELAEAWMDCVRQTGRDVRVLQPDFVPLDLVMVVCVEPSAFAAEVLAQIRTVLVGGTADRRPFFHPDAFTFGTPLRRAALEAAVQAVPGVRSVRRMRIRLRGVSPLRDFRRLTQEVSPDQVLRLDDDPLRPENGTLQLAAEGGA